MKDRMLKCELKFNGETIDSEEFGPFTVDEAIVKGAEFSRRFAASPLKEKGVTLVYACLRLLPDMPENWLTGEGVELPGQSGAQA